MHKKINTLSPMQLSALKEAGNIGSGHAALALSQLIGHRIMVAVTQVRVGPLNSMVEVLGPKNALTYGVCLKVLGDLQGAILFGIPREPAFALVDILMNKEVGTTKRFEELENSCLKEVASILTGAYLNALSDLLSDTLIPTAPRLFFDQAERVFYFATEVLDGEVDVAIGIETEFIEAHHKIRAQFILMLDRKGTESLVGKLKT